MRPIRIATVSATLPLVLMLLGAFAPAARADSCGGLISVSLGPGCSPIIQIGGETDSPPDSSACAGDGCVAIRAPKSEAGPAQARPPASKPAPKPRVHRTAAVPAPAPAPRANWLDDAREFYTGAYDVELPYGITPPRRGVTKWLVPSSDDDPLPVTRGFDFGVLTTDPRPMTSLIVGIMLVLGAGRIRRLLLHP